MLCWDPKKRRGGRPLRYISTSERPSETELLTRHTSSTGTRPAVSFTKSAEKEKIRDDRNEHVKPLSQISLQGQNSQAGDLNLQDCNLPLAYSADVC